jgi:hypothetical protein
MSKNYVPGKDLAFDAWLLFLVKYVMAKTSGSPPPWIHIPLEALGAKRWGKPEGVRWLTSTLKEGPWSEIFHVVIP